MITKSNLTEDALNANNTLVKQREEIRKIVIHTLLLNKSPEYSLKPAKGEEELQGEPTTKSYTELEMHLWKKGKVNLYCKMHTPEAEVQIKVHLLLIFTLIHLMRINRLKGIKIKRV